MGKNANRIGALGLLAATAVFLFPGIASADTADPAISGSCDATLRNGGTGQALTVDAGAPLNAPNTVSVGTGSDSANTGSGAAKQPTLSLPLADITKGLDVGGLPVLGAPVTDTVCPGAQNTVNALSATTQGLIAGKPLQPAPPAGNPAPAPAPAPAPTPAPGAPAPGSGAASGGFELVSFPLDGAFPLGAADLSALIAPGAIAPSAPSLVPPTGTSPGPGIVNQNSGTAEALPAASTAPEKLPLILAAVALALVTAALSNIWLRRSVK
ncbi:hypothetical protein HFP15_10125 [Amycolatopsis sp. K13G38]|uniref:Uncharacterized protein n=1 Tax=Amycolatopsis acididurans TaxID=2724524 RepID=A0ABX1J0Q2_9PSEU|nr:hypothetical protein [Amycolatopsis acididurans]NKQ53239.1 hypothetical protein [Amycolatopsis acididurans]